MLSVFAPYLAEELWQTALGHDQTIVDQAWPEFSEVKLQTKTVNLVFQVNGKVRGTKEVDKGLSREKLITLAKEDENVAKFLVDKEIVKEIVVLDKIVNFVVK